VTGNSRPDAGNGKVSMRFKARRVEHIEGKDVVMAAMGKIPRHDRQDGPDRKAGDIGIHAPVVAGMSASIWGSCSAYQSASYAHLSSNDSFPTAMHIASVSLIDERVVPELCELAGTIDTKAQGSMDVVKVGRTHLEDATPLSVGQEWSGWASQLRACADEIEHSREGLYALALGGTAVGTGLNAPKGFSKKVAANSRSRAPRKTVRGYRRSSTAR
jgi:adenylosuccinate lyase